MQNTDPHHKITSSQSEGKCPFHSPEEGVAFNRLPVMSRYGIGEDGVGHAELIYSGHAADGGRVTERVVVPFQNFTPAESMLAAIPFFAGTIDPHEGRSLISFLSTQSHFRDRSDIALLKKIYQNTNISPSGVSLRLALWGISPFMKELLIGSGFVSEFLGSKSPDSWDEVVSNPSLLELQVERPGWILELVKLQGWVRTRAVSLILGCYQEGKRESSTEAALYSAISNQFQHVYSRIGLQALKYQDDLLRATIATEVTDGYVNFSSLGLTDAELLEVQKGAGFSISQSGNFVLQHRLLSKMAESRRETSVDKVTLSYFEDGQEKNVSIVPAEACPFITKRAARIV